MEKDQILSEDSAREQLQTLLDFYGVDLDELGDVASRVSKRLISAIQTGKVEVVLDQEGIKVIQNTHSGKSFTYGEVTGQAKVAMEKYDGSHARLYGLLAVLSKRPFIEIQKLSAGDLSIAEYLALVFLAG